MDNYQVCALRHKRHIIASNVQLDDNTVDALTNRKLINRAMLDSMKVVKLKSQLIARYSDMYQASNAL